MIKLKTCSRVVLSMTNNFSHFKIILKHTLTNCVFVSVFHLKVISSIYSYLKSLENMILFKYYVNFESTFIGLKAFLTSSKVIILNLTSYIWLWLYKWSYEITFSYAVEWLEDHYYMQLEAAHEREKDLLNEVTELQWRYVHICMELQFF